MTLNAKLRQDAWLPEEDTILAETVLFHISEGKTQLSAFEAAAEKLKRTSGACGFRWNNDVRKKYEEGIKAAKKEKKLYKTTNKKQLIVKASEAAKENTMGEFVGYDTIIEFLKNQQSVIAEKDSRIRELQMLLRQKEDRIIELEEKLSQQNNFSTEPRTPAEDFENLIKILERARKLGVLSDNDKDNSEFKMDDNGNLERVAK